jgi:hypothetical protein
MAIINGNFTIYVGSQPTIAVQFTVFNPATGRDDPLTVTVILKTVAPDLQPRRIPTRWGRLQRRNRQLLQSRHAQSGGRLAHQFAGTGACRQCRGDIHVEATQF